MFENFNEVHVKHDHLSGCTFIIVLNTKDGKRCSGGTRMKCYSTLDEGVSDAVLLAQTMSKKCAVIGPEFNGGFSGGKGVIVGDPLRQKTHEMLMRYGEFVNLFNGRFVTGTDFNISDIDAQYMAKTSSYIDGLSTGLIDDTAVGTAYGVLFSMRKVAEIYCKTNSFSGMRVSVQGLGSIGMRLVELLCKENVEVVITDSSQEKINLAVEQFNVNAVLPDDIYKEKCDIFSPNAIGGIINGKNISRLKCRFIIGSANNQLDLKSEHFFSESTDFDKVGKDVSSIKYIDQLLKSRGIVYLTDYVVNIGGIYTSICEQRNKNKAYMLNTLEEIINGQIDFIYKLSIENKSSFLVSSEEYISMSC